MYGVEWAAPPSGSELGQGTNTRPRDMQETPRPREGSSDSMYIAMSLSHVSFVPFQFVYVENVYVCNCDADLATISVDVNAGTGVDRWGTGGTRPPHFSAWWGPHRKCPPHFFA